MQPFENTAYQIMHLLSAHDQMITVCVYHLSFFPDNLESSENSYIKPPNPASLPSNMQMLHTCHTPPWP